MTRQSNLVKAALSLLVVATVVSVATKAPPPQPGFAPAMSYLVAGPEPECLPCAGWPAWSDETTRGIVAGLLEAETGRTLAPVWDGMPEAMVRAGYALEHVASNGTWLAQDAGREIQFFRTTARAERAVKGTLIRTRTG